MKVTKSGIQKKYAKQRAELKKSFYSLKRQGFAIGDYRSTLEYKNVLKRERDAIYRLKNKDKIAQRRRERRNFKGTGEQKTIVACDSLPANRAFGGGKSSSFFKVLQLLSPNRAFFGYIEIINNIGEDGDVYPGNLIKRPNNPYLSIAGYYKRISEIISFIQNDTEREYLFLSCIVSIVYTYNDSKLVVTHIFDFSNS